MWHSLDKGFHETIDAVLRIRLVKMAAETMMLYRPYAG
jgi:hypothetical protein